jgi:hypothetical protein
MTIHEVLTEILDRDISIGPGEEQDLIDELDDCGFVIIEKRELARLGALRGALEAIVQAADLDADGQEYPWRVISTDLIERARMALEGPS